MGRNRVGNSLRYLLATAAIALAAACSGGDNITNSDVIPLDQEPLFAAGTPANGPGQCLLDDVIDAGFINSGDVNCTSEDVDIAIASATTYSVNGGPFVTLASTGGKILCSTGDLVDVNGSAQVINHAQERYDVGLWLGLSGADALTGASCNHYNLVAGANGSTNIDGDQCGDVQANITVDVPLGTLDNLLCVDGDPDPNVTALTISACAAWQNSVGQEDRICPTGSGGSFRLGTTPETPAKCKCEDLSLPLDIRGTITIIKNTVGGNGTFAFTHNVAANSNPTVSTPFNITTVGNTGQQVFSNVVAGTYTVTESAPPAGWQFTSLVCTAGGAVNAQTATITLAAGASVTCTFTNTQQGSITIIKNTVGGNGTFAFTHTVGTASDPDVPSPFNITTVANTGQQQFLNVAPGTYTVTESAPPAGWQFTSLSCTAGGSNAGQVATIILPAGGSVTCTFTNTQEGSITIIKDAQNPATDPEDFSFTTTGTGVNPFTLDDDGGADATNLSQISFSNLLPGTRTFTEGAETNWALTNISCTGQTSSTIAFVGANADPAFQAGDNQVSVGLVAGESVTCTFVNQRLARLLVRKVLLGGGTQSFEFTRNPGGVSFSLVDGGENNSGFTLLPGTYRVCELNLAVAFATTATLDAIVAALINPDGAQDLGNRCVDVVLAFGDTRILVFLNVVPPGGDARTIGYWKNWSSCAQSNGKQFEKAVAAGNFDKTLDGNLPQTIGDVTLEDCAEAVAILNKSDIVTGQKRANDPAYNLAAQLLAAKLNVTAGAGTCAAALTAIADAQALLDLIGFTGTGSYTTTMTAAQKTQANTLAGILDSYNNNTLCP